MTPPDDSPSRRAFTPDLESTAALLGRVRSGDEAARQALFARYLPVLRRWSHGRLPAGARGMADTDDLVQITLARALIHLETFEHRHEGAFLAYLRQSVINAVRNEIRRSGRRPSGAEPDLEVADGAPPVLDQVIARESMQHYEAALLELTEDQRHAVILRLEFGYSYPAISEAMGRATPEAARMLVVRGLVRLAEVLGERDI